MKHLLLQLIAAVALLASESAFASLPIVFIKDCYDGDTCTTLKGEKIRLACIDTPELKGWKADPIPAKEARDYVNKLLANEKVSIKRITKDKYGRTVGELFKTELIFKNLSLKKDMGKYIRNTPINVNGFRNKRI